MGKPIRELTLAQLRTVDAGVSSGIPTLAEACTLLAPADVTLSVELKTDPTWTDEEVELFTAAVVNVLKSRGMTERTRLLAFDWRVLVEARCHYPELGRVALSNARPSSRTPPGWPVNRPRTRWQRPSP